jgi:hypothetical protein
MKLFATFLFIFMINISFAQKVKVKNNIGTVDKVTYCTFVDDEVNLYSFSLYSNNKEEGLYFKLIIWGEGKYCYFEIYDMHDLSTMLCETDGYIGCQKRILELLVKSKVIDTTGLNEEELKIFVEKKGKEFSRQRAEHVYQVPVKQ